MSVVPERVHVPGFPNTAAARAKLDTSFDRAFGHGWTPGKFDPETSTIAVVQERPDAQRLTLAPDFKGSQVDALAEQARQRGFDLVEVSLHEKYAIIAHLSPEARAIRNRLASFLKVRPWEVEVAVELDPDNPRVVDLVQVLRAPEVGTDAEKRLAVWRAAVLVIPGAHADWRIEEDLVSGRAVLERRDPLRLPQRVPLADLTIDFDPDLWDFIPHGQDTGARVVGQKLSVPHGLVAGETGAGKSYFLLAHAVGALSRGHDLIVVDPTKNAVDFTPLHPWCAAVAVTTLPEARAVIETVYAERVRRQKVLQAHGIGFWAKLPADVRAAEGIRPVTVIIDEAASLLEDSSANLSALDKDDPLRVEFEQDRVAKTIIRLYLGKLGREARNVGIHMVLGVQRPDTSFLPGEFRANIGQKVQLKVPGSAPMAPESLRMLFPGQFAPEASDLLGRLGDMPGSGVTMAEGGAGVAAFRVAYEDALRLPALLEARGVPRAQKWEIMQPESPTPAALADPFEGFSDDPFADFDDDPFADLGDDPVPPRRGADAPATPAEFSLDDLLT